VEETFAGNNTLWVELGFIVTFRNFWTTAVEGWNKWLFIVIYFSLPLQLFCDFDFSICCQRVSNTITQLRLLGCVFLELHYWANRVKYVLPNISKLWTGFSLKLSVRIGWTSYFVLKETKWGFSSKFGTLAPSKWPTIGDKHPHDSDHAECWYCRTVSFYELSCSSRRFVLVVGNNRCRLRQKSWKNPGRIYADNSAVLDEGLGNPICSDLMFEVLDGRLVLHWCFVVQ